MNKLTDKQIQNIFDSMTMKEIKERAKATKETALP